MTVTPPQVPPYHGDVAPETCLRLVDEAIVNWLSTLRYRTLTPKVVTAWASRQFAQQHEVHDGKPTKQAVPYPMVSVFMSGITPDLSRRVVGEISHLGQSLNAPDPELYLHVGDGSTASYEGRLTPMQVVPQSVTFTADRQTGVGPPPTYVAMTVTDDGEGHLVGDVGSGLNVIDYATGKYTVTFSNNVMSGKSVKCNYQSSDDKMYVGNDLDEVYVLPFPIPFDLQYQVDIWTKTQQDMQLLRTALLCRFPFGDETFLRLDLPDYGNPMIPVIFNRLDDTTDVEPDENNRELRNTITLTAKAWIFQVPMRRKTIKNLSVVLLDAGTDPANLLDDSAFLQWYCDITHYTFSGSSLTAVQESPTLAPPNRAIMWMSWEEGSLVKIGQN